MHFSRREMKLPITCFRVKFFDANSRCVFCLPFLVPCLIDSSHTITLIVSSPASESANFCRILSFGPTCSVCTYRSGRHLSRECRQTESWLDMVSIYRSIALAELLWGNTKPQSADMLQPSSEIEKAEHMWARSIGQSESPNIFSHAVSWWHPAELPCNALFLIFSHQRRIHSTVWSQKCPPSPRHRTRLRHHVEVWSRRNDLNFGIVSAVVFCSRLAISSYVRLSPHLPWDRQQILIPASSQDVCTLRLKENQKQTAPA